MSVVAELANVGSIDGEPVRKSRRGTEKRQRTEQVKLSLLPAERRALERAAADAGLEGAGTIQAFIRMRLAPDLVTSGL